MGNVLMAGRTRQRGEYKSPLLSLARSALPAARPRLGHSGVTISTWLTPASTNGSPRRCQPTRS